MHLLEQKEAYVKDLEKTIEGEVNAELKNIKNRY